MPLNKHRTHTLRLLIASMASVALIVGASAITLLYRAAYDQSLVEMQQSASTLANLIEAMAQFDKKNSEQTHPQGHWGATMSQVEAGILLQASSPQSNEIVIGQRVGDEILVFRAIPGKGLHEVARLPIDGKRARPLFLALRGERGSGELPDYAGNSVLVGYAPVPTLGIGIVYKIDTATVRAPFIRASLWIAAIAALLIALGAVILARITRPLQRRAAESEQRFTALVNSVPVGVFEADVQGRCTFANDHLCQLASLPAEKLLGDNWVQALHPEDSQRVQGAWGNFVQLGMPFAIEFRFLRPDGSVRWLFGQATRLLDQEDKLRGYSGTITDITERVNVERDLNTFKTTLDQTLDCVFMFDAETLQFLYANQGALNQVAYSREELLQMTPVDIKPLFDEAQFRAQLLPLLSGTRQALRFETLHRSKHGEDIPVAIFLQYIQPPADRARFVAVVRDISEQLRDQKALQQANQALETRVAQRTAALETAKNDAERANAAKSTFLSRMSHELRTPMNAILGFSQVLELEPLDPEQQSFVTEIYQAGQHLLQLIDELLDLSRIEAGKLIANIQSVNLAPILLSALQLNQSAIQARGISVLNQCHADIAVLADATRLRQILLNLLSNAAKYNREGGSIRIDGAALDADHWRISITDTGPGIAPENLDKLFTPFERLGAEFTNVSGTGIGLSLCQKLAELMGAKLGVSSAPGQGATFWIDLPRTEPSQDTSASSALTTTPMKRTKMLYVEDNAANLKVVEAMLRRHPDLSLISASNGEYGLELARLYRPDAILLDIHLPGMDGYAVLAALQADSATRDIPVLALSADAMPLDVERGLKAGFVRYITKPVKREDLLEAVQAALQVRNKPSAIG